MKFFKRSTLATLSLAAMVTTMAGMTAAADQQVIQAVPGVDNTPQHNATSTLKRFRHGIAIDVDTSGLDPASPYTVWAVIFNNPEYCLSIPCGIPDLPVSPGHDPRVDASMVFAAGGVSDTEGHGAFLGRVRKAHHRVTSETVLGSGAMNVNKAEIHVVVRGHGSPEDSDLLSALSSFAGGCTVINPCEDQQFAIHRGW